ncbi:MAG: ABC transporter permease [Fibrobacteria bacterium]|nr:ABC transporter permease [Fibrobacteria bacterium]
MNEFGINKELQSLQDEIKRGFDSPPPPEVQKKRPKIKTVKEKTAQSDFWQQDTSWLFSWIGTILFLTLWNAIFLNKPAFKQIATGFINTVIISLQVILFSLVLAWGVSLLLNHLSANKKQSLQFMVTFFLNLIRSIPQIVGILFGYIWITSLSGTNGSLGNFLSFTLIAIIISLFIFIELADLMLERIQHFKKLDFYDAMRVCGIKESRIINFHILWKNSRIHILNKLISIFGMAIFLQCSVSFIISVGLSMEIDLVSLPNTLGTLLAKIDSKQDILAIGYAITHPGYIPQLFFKHLQGITVSFLLVFTLLSIYKIAGGFAKRYKL